MPLLGEPLTLSYQISPDWYAMGFMSDPRKESIFQGFHAENLLLVVDEFAMLAKEYGSVLTSPRFRDTASASMLGIARIASRLKWDERRTRASRRRVSTA